MAANFYNADYQNPSPAVKAPIKLESPNGSDSSSSLKMKITELELQLRMEKESSALLKSELELKWVGLFRDTDKYRRECDRLRVYVARLEEDCTALRGSVRRLEEEGNKLRERGVKDGETIQGLVVEVNKKDEELKSKDVESSVEVRDTQCAMKRAQDQADEWKKKYEESRARELGLVAQIFQLKNDKGKKLSGDGEEGTQMSSGQPTKGYEFVVVDSDNEGENGVNDEFLNGQNRRTPPIAQLTNNRQTTPKLVDRAMNTEPEVPTNSMERNCTNERNDGSDRIMLSEMRKRKCADVDVTPARKEAGDNLPIGLGTRSKVHEETGRLALSSSRNKAKEVSILKRQRSCRSRSNINGPENPVGGRVYTGRYPSSEQQHHALERAKDVQRNLRYPSFVKSMGKSHVSWGFWLNLPPLFCKENLPDTKMDMTLEDEKGSKYPVIYIGEKCALSGGWRGFAIKHRLEVGDALLFELNGQKKFKVYIVKAFEESGDEDDADDRNPEADAAAVRATPIQWTKQAANPSTPCSKAWGSWPSVPFS